MEKEREVEGWSLEIVEEKVETVGRCEELEGRAGEEKEIGRVHRDQDSYKVKPNDQPEIWQNK